jgi:ribA/ribD-fused uncharacterized protein
MIVFNSKSATFSEFSNFHSAPFTLNGSQWPTVEHYFQAQKFPSDPALQEKIRSAKTALSAKRLGRTKTDAFLSNWDTIKDGVMETALIAKFTQNPPLQELLKSTGDAYLQEKSSSDNYWAAGPSGCGKNKMGHLLMKIRTQI